VYQSKYFWAETSRDLREELKRTIDHDETARLQRKQPLRHFMVTVRQFLFLGLSTWALIRYENCWIVVFAAFLSGVTVFNFTVLLHEQLHNLIFSRPHPLFNRLLGHLYAFWSGISSSQFTRWHLDHHLQLGSPVLDPKRHHLSPRKNSRLIKLLYFSPALFIIYFRAAAKETASYPLELRKKIRRERLVSISGHLAFQVALIVWGSLGIWFRAYALPVYFVFPLVFALNRVGQHYNITPDDPAGWTTWMAGHWFWDFLYLNSNYHLEHHYFPGVPFYNLPRLQALLTPLYLRHGLKPFNYLRLLYGYLVLNRQPHTHWDFA